MPENTLSILTYHAIDDRDSVISVPPELFRRQMDLLAESGVRGISLASAFDSLDRTGYFPERCVVLTFDDGYRSVFEQALPVMTKLGFGGTAFITTDFIGLDAAQARQRNADMNRDLMGWNHICRLAESGFEIGAHSMSHPDLTRLSAGRLEQELAVAEKLLEEQVLHPVRSFAYPYGYYDERVRKAVSGHFRLACTTVLGHNGPEQDALLLNRLDVYYMKRESVFVRACMGGLGPWWGFRQALRSVKSIVTR